MNTLYNLRVTNSAGETYLMESETNLSTACRGARRLKAAEPETKVDMVVSNRRATDAAGDAVDTIRRMTNAAAAEAAVTAALRAALVAADEMPDGVVDASRITAAQYAADRALHYSLRVVAAAGALTDEHRAAADNLRGRAVSAAFAAEIDVAAMHDIVDLNVAA